MFKPRTQPVHQGEAPFRFDVESVWQCSWFCYYEALQKIKSAPCWWDRATKTGSYTNAKDWLENYREPWEVKGTDWTPKAGDIAVYDGEYGHVIFMETDTMTAEYRNGDQNSFRIGKFGDYKGTLLGFLHYPYESVDPVERNVNLDQIQTLDEALRIRTEPSLSGEIIGHVSLGFYNVLNQKEADGYVWYEIAKDRWCANVETIYLPKENDFVDEIRKWADTMIDKARRDEQTIIELKSNMRNIEEIAKKWNI